MQENIENFGTLTTIVNFFFKSPFPVHGNMIKGWYLSFWKFSLINFSVWVALYSSTYPQLQDGNKATCPLSNLANWK